MKRPLPFVGLSLYSTGYAIPSDDTAGTETFALVVEGHPGGKRRVWTGDSDLAAIGRGLNGGEEQ